MDDVKSPSLDLQTHLAELAAKGLLIRIDRPISKDTELHPLVRCEFVGDLPEDGRRAFLFTNVVDSSGRRYDMPVVVGAFAASPRIYAIGMRRPVDAIGAAWIGAIAQPIAPVMVSTASCQEVVITGEADGVPSLGDENPDNRVARRGWRRRWGARSARTLLRTSPSARRG